MEYKTVALAGLLHDIGKFFQKGNFPGLKVTGKHPEVSARFVRAFKDTFASVCDVNLLENLVLKHHEHPGFPEELQVNSAPQEIIPLALLVSRADNYSSAERGETGDIYHDYKTRPLDSVFCRLDIGKKLPKMLGYKVGVYSPKNCFPEDIREQTEKDLNDLLRDFGGDFARLVQKRPDYDTLYTGLYSLLLKYTWCIPSNSQENIADVSLFDHLKTTSAIASSLYLYHRAHKNLSIENIKKDSEDKFLLVVGDISGIQNYIFSGISIGSSGVARKLRARSFLINMLSELTAHQLIRELNLPLANIIMSSGGRFYVLMPNIEEAIAAINKTQDTLDRWMLDTYRGELAINLAYQSLSGENFNVFGTMVEKVNRKLTQKKMMPFISVLQHDSGWVEKNFTFDVNDEYGLGPCRGCGREFAKKTIDDIGYGSRCLKEMELGSRLPKTQIIDFTSSDYDIEAGFNIGIKLKKEIGRDNDESELTVILNDNNIPLDRPVFFYHLANHVPIREDRIMIFDEIASCSKGVKKLAFLKADVDHLGKLFAFGLKQENDNFDTISRVATLSRMLDLFFTGYINELLHDKYPNCYTVFSGGDDLVIIGPWNEIIELALSIQGEFCRFTGSNPNLTFSAGISLVRTRTPVSKAMQSTEMMLEQAKENIRPNCSESRNQVSIFGRTLSWEGLRVTVTEGQNLSRWINSRKMNKADLWRLKQYDQLYQSFICENNVEGLLYKAFLAYWIGRSKKDRNIDQQVLAWHEKLLENMDVNLESLGPIADYAYCSTREVD
ncbi:MAG: type III-A CRISPR-associated protein Cas10/Csm1 [Bacillota bacterium]|nr:type III-A CRISPR-associated protein Cas10/Csm1 [Bacillota bacterium]